MNPSDKNTGVSRRGAGLYYLIFFASGFAGLIYESIWTHYIKLFLGHAAYAQTLVLGIFMGGMALGSWICSRRSGRWSNLLRVYALTELCIGFFGLVFHPVFVRFLEFAYSTGIPSLQSPEAVIAFKWISSACLILPQSVLLGMTFPLMTGGLLRRHPDTPGGTIAMLYFTNSLGAAIGVLASGFWLMARAGLPGTIMTAGVINVVQAAWIWRISPDEAPEGSAAFGDEASAQRPPSATVEQGYLIFLLIALITGASSFVYEIGWIRMLSLVLGGSTHAFELMLSAFITGLAFGGLWIKRRIDRSSKPTRLLAFVQLAMGALALGTLPVYNNMFGVMRWLIGTLDKTDSGYMLFNLASHGIALVVMLPATFCAGMTLPLITYLLLRKGHGEKSIGAVYSFNTLGAITGIFFAVHVGMPELGLKGLITVGAALDMALGLFLLWRDSPTARGPLAAAAAGSAMVISTLMFVNLDPVRMASGVYRTGELAPPDEAQILYQKDGKTATVSVMKNAYGVTIISTNGKPDASIILTGTGKARVVGSDETTQVLLGALPALLNPRARTAANIGFGSGLTTHTLMTDPRLERVDTIEIEPAMVEGARIFMPRVSLAYRDPRSHVHIEDAKTYFSNHNNKYDIIVSEPSNPWVSGVSGLFSVEFYKVARRYLADGGILVQWLQLYEIDPGLVSSVVKALSSQFNDYVVYAANEADIIIIATPDGNLPERIAGPGLFPGLAAELGRINIRNKQDLELRRIGDKKLLGPLFDSYGEPPNSDYYPILDLNAVRTRFLGSDASELVTLRRPPVPVMEILEGARPDRSVTSVSFDLDFLSASNADLATTLLGYLSGHPWHWAHKGAPLPPNTRENAEAARRILGNCGPGLTWNTWVGGMHNTVAVRMIPYLSPVELEPIWSRLEGGECWKDLEPSKKLLVRLYRSVGERENGSMVAAAENLLSAERIWDPVILEYALAAAMAGEIAGGRKSRALDLWNAYSGRLGYDGPIPLFMRLLVAHSQSDSLSP